MRTYKIPTCFGLSRLPFGSSSWHTVRTATSFALTPSLTIHPSHPQNQQSNILFLSLKLHIVATRSFPISSPVCLPTNELNSSRYFFNSQTVSLCCGKSINDMLNDVKGCRLRVDHPSQITDTLD